MTTVTLKSSQLSRFISSTHEFLLMSITAVAVYIYLLLKIEP